LYSGHIEGKYLFSWVKTSCPLFPL